MYEASPSLREDILTDGFAVLLPNEISEAVADIADNLIKSLSYDNTIHIWYVYILRYKEEQITKSIQF